MTEPERKSEVSFLGEVRMREHVLRFSLDRSLNLLFIDCYHPGRFEGELLLKDCRRIEGPAFVKFAHEVGSRYLVPRMPAGKVYE